MAQKKSKVYDVAASRMGRILDLLVRVEGQIADVAAMEQTSAVAKPLAAETTKLMGMVDKARRALRVKRDQETRRSD